MTSTSVASHDPSSLIADALAIAQRRLVKACRAAGRDEAGATLVAVTKNQLSPAVEAALSAGQRVFGENRVQEARERWWGRRAAHPDLELRLIGPLQTNKADDAVALFDVIETIDRERLAEALAKAAEKVGRAPRVMIQVNTGAEPQKAGVLPENAEVLIDRVRGLGLPLVGLMCIPPADQAPGPHFALLRKIARRNGLAELSMGMSADYEVAVRFGATHVRLGAALFGERKTT